MIKVYSKPQCGKCDMLKRWLDIKKIEFTEVNIMEDDDSLSKLRDAGRLSLPVLEINEEFVDYDEFNDILELI